MATAARERDRGEGRRDDVASAGAAAGDAVAAPGGVAAARGARPRRALTLVASDVAPIGGMERVAFELGRRLLDRGWELTVIARTCELDGARHVRLRGPARPESVAFPLLWFSATRALRRHRNGIVQANNPTVGGAVDVVNVHFCEAAYRAEVGASRSRRATALYRLNSWIVSAMGLAAERAAYRPAGVRALACVSEGVARDVRGHHPGVADRVRVIPNGVDRAAFAPDPAVRAATRSELGIALDEHVALFVGGDWQRKGLRHAVEAIERAPGWRLVVVGPGDRTPYAGAPRVTFVGRQRAPHRFYAAADVLLLPSGYEAFPLVTLEAAAAGLALVVPRINGTEELVEHGTNGWFTAADPHAIAQRLRRLRAEPHTLAAMREAARASSERYDWDRVVDRYERLYDELVRC